MKIDRSKFLSLCFSMLPVVAIGCGGSGDDGTAGGGSAVSAGNPAGSPSASPAPAPAPAPAAQALDVVTVNTTVINKTVGKCVADVKAPVVSIPTNKGMESAINGVLAPLSDDPCKEGGDSGVDISSEFEVTANANGLLSIRVTGDSFFEGAAHPNNGVQTFNFDIKNGGKRLKLGDVITPAGSAKALATCIAAINAEVGDTGAPAAPSAGDIGSPVDESFGATTCPGALVAQFEIEPDFVATKDGLEIDASVPHALGDFFPFKTPWKDLVTDGLTSSVVADFAKAQK